jgi:hypothetical protein
MLSVIPVEGGGGMIAFFAIIVTPSRKREPRVFME